MAEARAYYNDVDPAAVHVLRALIAEGVIAPGDVDDRSIKDVQPNDLKGYAQAHFFAGGGLWSVAARLAGWPDDRPLWTGSCPCQPFSNAGKRLGTDDPRHLWPDFFRLIRDARPDVVVGEQVSGAAGYDWFDGVCADLAAEGYAAEAVDIPACAVDAPHKRNRLYWAGVQHHADGVGRVQALGKPGHCHASGQQGPADSPERIHRGDVQSHAPRVGWGEGRIEHVVRSGRRSAADDHAFVQSNADSCGRAGRPEGTQRSAVERAAVERPDGELQHVPASDGREQRLASTAPMGHGCVAASTHGRNGSFWSDAEWIVSPIDGKARRAKPGIRFLVDGLPGRVDLWRIGGNAIVPVLAAEALAALLETLGA